MVIALHHRHLLQSGANLQLTQENRLQRQELLQLRDLLHMSVEPSP